MVINTGSSTLDSLLNKQLLSLASRSVPQGNLLSAVSRIREAAFHDFSNYRFLLSPHYIRKLNISPYPGGMATVDGTAVSLGIWMEFDSFSPLFDTCIDTAIADWINSEGSKMILGGYDSEKRFEIQDAQVVNAIHDAAKRGFHNGMAPDLFEIYYATPQPDQFLISAYQAVTDWLKVSFLLAQPTSGKMV